MDSHTTGDRLYERRIIIGDYLLAWVFGDGCNLTCWRFKLGELVTGIS